MSPLDAFSLPAGAAVNFMSRGHWQERVGRNGFASRSQSMWLLQYLTPIAQAAALASATHYRVCNLSSPPLTTPVLHNSKSTQQSQLAFWCFYIGTLLASISIICHGKREVLEAKFQESSTCVIPPYNFSAIQRATVMPFLAGSGCQPRVGEHSSLNFLSTEIMISPYISSTLYQCS